MAARRRRAVRAQQQRQRGWKLCSFHAPEAECIGKGKASAPHEFPCRSLDRHHQCPRPRGGQFVAPCQCAAGQSLCHTLAVVIDATEKLNGCAIERACVDKRVPRSRRGQPAPRLRHQQARTASTLGHRSRHWPHESRPLSPQRPRQRRQQRATISASF
jgi:hypothetical protein